MDKLTTAERELQDSLELIETMASKKAGLGFDVVLGAIAQEARAALRILQARAGERVPPQCPECDAWMVCGYDRAHARVAAAPIAQPAEPAAHAAIGDFLRELYATMVDPCAEGQMTVAEITAALLTAARQQREQLAKAEPVAQPVAWRWRSWGTVNWIYDPERSWLESQGDSVEKEPLYAAPVDRPQAQFYTGSAFSASLRALCRLHRKC